MNNMTIIIDESLSIKNTIHIKYCHNLIIKNTSNNNKINKIIIEKCNNITINFQNSLSLVNGIEINKSNKIIIISEKSTSIPLIELFKSTLYIIGSIDSYKDIKINSELSELYNIE